jgi:site-specific recombinase XerD
MCLLAAYQGLRVHEIAKMHGRDVDLGGALLRVSGKGGVVAELPLHSEVERAALTMPRSSWWFSSTFAPDRPIQGRTVTTHISTAMRRAGVAGVPHSLRHWHATALLRGGTDIRTVQTLMRHASLATTQVYLEVTDEDRRAAVLRLPVLGDVAP